MRRAIRSTCTYCRCDTYFDVSVEPRLEAIAAGDCAKCGRTGVVITLGIEPPDGVVIQDHIPRAHCR